MIVGRVNADAELIVPLEVLDQAGQPRRIEAILDTGFNGGLTLPPAVIASLGLAFRTQSTAILADGSVQNFDVFVANVLWDGRRRTVLVQSIDADTLLGMTLVVGHTLSARVVDGGRVEMDAIP